MVGPGFRGVAADVRDGSFIRGFLGVSVATGWYKYTSDIEPHGEDWS